MAVEHLPQNLRLLCSYSRSVSDACRRMRLNRQQFNKYLSGQTRPSLRNLRRIADCFGLDESELLLDHAAFRKLVSVRRPVLGSFDDLPKHLREILLLTPEHPDRSLEHTGYYFTYFRPAEYGGRILRAFIHVFEKGGLIFSRNIERYPFDPFRSTRKYNGLFLRSSDQILMIEREATVGRTVWLTILYPRDRDQPSLLSGLTLGITSNTPRDIVCYRSVLQYLGRSVDPRPALRQCGLFENDDARIDPAIRSRLRSPIHTSDLPVRDADLREILTGSRQL